jgi:hypothetical protein
MQNLTIETSRGTCTLTATRNSDRFELIGTYAQCAEIIETMDCVDIDDLEATENGCILDARIVREFFPKILA